MLGLRRAPPTPARSMLDRVLGRKNENAIDAFYTLRTNDERRAWLNKNKPWSQLSPAVIDAILTGIADVSLLEVFINRSIILGLVDKYKALNNQRDPIAIRGSITHLLSIEGAKALNSIVRAVKAKELPPSGTPITAADCFELTIAMTPDNLGAYIGMATICALADKVNESREWAERGLVRLRKVRPMEAFMVERNVIDAGYLDNTEIALQNFLQN